METAKLDEIGRGIRRSATYRTVALLVLLGLAGGPSFRGYDLAQAAGVLIAVYLVVTSTWAYVAATRILHQFCVQSVVEVARLQEEIEKLKAAIEGKNG